MCLFAVSIPHSSSFLDSRSSRIRVSPFARGRTIRRQVILAVDTLWKKKELIDGIGLFAAT